MANVNRPNAPQNYRSPPELLRAVVERFGRFTFDAACLSTDAVAPEGYAFDRGFDALARDWRELAGHVVWCNPPWRLAGRFAAKAAASCCKVLLNCQLAPDAAWYERHVHGRALVLALNPRVPYLNQDGSPAFTDKAGKALGINRPAMVAAYGFGQVGFEPWRWLANANGRGTP